MGALDEAALAVLLSGQGGNEAIAASDPYLEFKQAPDAISELIIKESANPAYSTRDKIIAGLVSGLVSGGFEGLSNDYQSRAQSAYGDSLIDMVGGRKPERPSVLTPSIFSQASQQADIFKNNISLHNALLDKDSTAKQRESIVSKFSDEIAKNPDYAGELIPEMQRMLAIVDGSPMAAPAAASPAISIPGAPAVGASPLKPGIPVVKSEAAKAAEPELDPAGEKVLSIIGDQFGGKLPESLAEKQKRLTSEIRRANRVTPNEASQRAAQQIEADRLALKATFKKADTARTVANKILEVADTAEAGIAGAGETGGGAIIYPVREALSFLYQIGSPEERQQRTAQGILDSTKVQSVQGMRGLGSLSNKEFETAISTYPNSGKTIEENIGLVEKIRSVGDLELEYADYLDWYRERFSTQTGADKVWQAYKNDHPLIVQDENGVVEFNKDRPSVYDWLVSSGSGGDTGGGDTGGGISGGSGDGAGFGGGQRVSLTPEQVRAGPQKDTQSGVEVFEGGVRNIINALTLGFGDEAIAGVSAAIATPFSDRSLGENYDIGLQQGRDVRTRFRAENPGTALLGDIAGAARLPFKSLIGTKATVAGKVLQGAKEGGKIGAAYGFGEGEGGFVNRVKSAATGGTVGAAAGGVVGGVVAGAEKATNYVKEIIGESKTRILGITPSAIKDSLDDGRAYLDDMGSPVKPSTEAELSTKLVEDVKIVDKDGLIAKLSDNAESNQKIFDIKQAEAGSALSNLRTEAGKIWNKVKTKIQPQKNAEYSFEKIRDPKTGRMTKDLGIQPNFSKVDDLIDRIRSTEGDKAANVMRTRADSVLAKWNAGPKTWDAIQDVKALFGESTKWSKGMGPTANAWNLVKAEINRSFARAQTAVFDDLVSAQNALTQSKSGLSAGALSAANRKYHAYKNLEGMITGRTSKTLPRYGYNPLSWPGTFSARNPVTAASIWNATHGIPAAAITKAGENAAPATAGVFAIGQNEGERESPQSIFKFPQKKKSMTENPSVKPISDIEALIDQDPIDSAIYEVESGRGKHLKNPKSSAKGIFQIVDKTARDLGAGDVMDPLENYKAYKKLREDMRDTTGDDPAMVYAGHFLGETTLRKWINGEPLTDTQEAHIREFKKEKGPLERFLAAYDRIVKKKSGTVDV